ncbi:hypothetical protein [Stenotrophomonas maltophilia]|uniref:hypothetical protein n=1 Tax=Stenotrophomonas maltophilia group TaxID=995085 RepID=UPI00070D6319|nr:hypothetical protein [Stenotrophomonas maltophilia]KRG61570.1 hypothetical protein ARC02_02515 [Stenotrophomonas maltophilia]NNH46649.1 hypothetical protein [Stenotrophomonas maltophilia]VEE52149.1 Uncharacterised protein [Stenotrophomonas maltophilia]
MTTDNKTLADVQPGGRVRLLDQTPFVFARFVNGVRMAEGVTIEKERNLTDAMKVAAKVASKGPNGEVPVLVHVAALSAQPSPGGQDALREAAEFARRVLAEIYATYQVKIGPFASQAQLANVKLGAALAARQPAGEPVAYMVRWKTAGGFGLEWPKNMQYFRDRADEYEIVPLYAQPAQAVNTPQPVAFDYPKFNAVGMGCVLEDRGVHFLIDAAQCGFDEALGQMKATLESIGPLYAAPPAQTVDLGQFRALAEFGEEFAFSAEKQPQSRVIYAQARRLLALIDSKAVGNG